MPRYYSLETKEAAVMDMEIAKVSQTLVGRLRALMHGCEKGDACDKRLDLVVALWSIKK